MLCVCVSQDCNTVVFILRDHVTYRCVILTVKTSIEARLVEAMTMVITPALDGTVNGSPAKVTGTVVGGDTFSMNTTIITDRLARITGIQHVILEMVDYKTWSNLTVRP